MSLKRKSAKIKTKPKRSPKLSPLIIPKRRSSANNLPSLRLKQSYSSESNSANNWKLKYEKLSEKHRKSVKELNDKDFIIHNLRKELKKKTSPNNNNIDDQTEKEHRRRIKHKEAEISNLRRRLTLAIGDMEKVKNWYKKQLESFKKNQNKWIKQQKSQLNNKVITKYVFASDIKKIKLRRTRGVKIYFNDNEFIVFNNIEVDERYDDNDDDHYELLQQLKKQKNIINKQQNQLIEQQNVINDDEFILDDENIIKLLLNELKGRVKDIQHCLGVKQLDNNYRNDNIVPRHSHFLYKLTSKKGFKYLEKLKKDNKFWLKLFPQTQNQQIKPKTKSKFSSKMFSLWNKSQNAIKNNKQPQIIINNNITLKNINNYGKDADISYSKHLQNKINKIPKRKYDAQSKNVDNDDDLSNMPDVSVQNGWFLAQMEIKQYPTKQPSVCIKNGVVLTNTINRNNKKKVKTTITGSFIQAKLDKNTSTGHNKYIFEIDEQDDTDDDDIDDMDDDKNNDDDDDDDDDNVDWLFTDEERNKFVNSVQISPEKVKLLKWILIYLNRIIPTSSDWNVLKQYIPIPTLSNNSNSQPSSKPSSQPSTKPPTPTHKNTSNNNNNNSIDALTDQDIRNLIHCCFDGVIMASLVNFVEDNLIDLRALNLPKKNREPLSKEEIMENISVVKSSIMTLDLCELDEFNIDYDKDDNKDDDDNSVLSYFNPSDTVNIQLLIIMHLFIGMLNNRINVFKYPELIRLCQNDIEKQECDDCSCKEWLTRWIIFIKNPKIKQIKIRKGSNNGHRHDLNSSIDLGKYSSPFPNSPSKGGQMTWKMISALHQKQTQINTLDTIEEYENDYFNDINAICLQLNISDNSVNSITQFLDLKNRNYLLQLIYLCDIFEKNNKIKKLTDKESQLLTKWIKEKPKDDINMIAWINSFKFYDDDMVNPDDDDDNNGYIYIKNLNQDINDGVILLYLLEKCVPNCVNWNHVRKTSRVRHKFDKLNNCKILIDICNKIAPFNEIFSLVGMGNNDIVDGNPKYIRSLLFQIQRYHSTKLLSRIHFGANKSSITDDELLKWINKRLYGFRLMLKVLGNNPDTNNYILLKKKESIQSFNDIQLGDSLHFMNLISSINISWINYNLINDPTTSATTTATATALNNKQKLQNASYLLTIMRKLGCIHLFVSKKQIINIEHRAVLTILTQIMYLCANYTKYDQLKLFATNYNKSLRKNQKKK